MPHTRRKIPPSQQHKRLQVTDSSGWTHVTTTGNARRLNRRHNRDQDRRNEGKTTSEQNGQEPEHETLEPLLPAEAPASVTLPELQKKLSEFRLKFEASETWRCAERAMRHAFPFPSTLLAGREGKNEADPDANELSIVCIGLGSPSGFLRGGWVDRRNVSMYQLAALTSIMGWIETNHPKPKLRLNTYAQDPVFNTHDKSLLESSSISVLEHPGAFEKVSSHTILFCPGAERRHLELLLSRDPAVIFGGPLEDIDSMVVKRYLEDRDTVKLGVFEEQEHAFWGMGVYFPSTDGNGEG
ncbi:hypothetical protein BJX99DRAFT_189212 [Aspergillus californicus]